MELDDTKLIKYYCFGDDDAKIFNEKIKNNGQFIQDEEPDIIIIVFNRLNRDCNYRKKYFTDIKNKFIKPPKWIYIISTGFDYQQISDMLIHNNSSTKGRLLQTINNFCNSDDYKIENHELLFVGGDDLPIYEMNIEQFIDHMKNKIINQNKLYNPNDNKKETVDSEENNISSPNQSIGWRKSIKNFFTKKNWNKLKNYFIYQSI